jgi:hypothetical protein
MSLRDCPAAAIQRASGEPIPRRSCGTAVILACAAGLDECQGSPLIFRSSTLHGKRSGGSRTSGSA